MPSLGTFNIRLFPDRGAELEAVADRVVELDADLFMVQEIREPEVFDTVLLEASRRLHRDYAVRLGPMCKTSELQLGVVYDRRRFREVEHRIQAELDPQARCSCRDGHPPALLVVLEEEDGARRAAMSVHLQYGGRRWMHRARRDQWDHLVASIGRVRAELGVPLAVAGDFNSTGFPDDDRGERRLIMEMTARAGMHLATKDLGCTAYWRPNRRKRDYEPSMLDHILLSTPPRGPAEALGMCRTLGGRRVPGDQNVADFHCVSDHCPVRVSW
ncbi:endonuclease/exonuclease/phosphatase family protein [Paraliomyxa miuraensis]|uniref:endonuclease/exonuclease/phosphatase family protein n=1 Tax=Paraliomyxa miuraensis TaxID=376150 RepID=UPI00225935C4|nr:endonuclease/exonuclease/phosphatase family protein [Paraliomyxa miuraensis]MCX4245157.1 endonuclease/exonuclease/phosphatase family protein [Paraliomyxa miuraensis]